MIARILLATADVPDGGQLKLWRRGDEFSIMLGGTELMNSRASGSETALATLAAARIGEVAAPAILIGGLGMGFTMRAALAAFGAAARITVAELVPAVIAWARGPMAAVYAGSLDDPRASVAAMDVAILIREARAAYDAILLDVDNGPDGLTRGANDWLYHAAGLAAARQALRPGGVLAVWSSAPDTRFTRRLHAAGFAVEEVAARATPGGRGARHRVWLAGA